MKRITIAIDGPAAAGKSTVAKIVAKELGYIYIDSGAMYRCITYKALKEKIDVNDENALYEMALRTNIDLKGSKVYMDDKDVSRNIRGIEVTKNVSAVSTHLKVREVLVKKQQELGANGGIVMDGRDIGTAVFPNAELKIYQIASVEQRARRRYEENIEKGIECDLREIEEDIKRRDDIDSHRKVSPLTMASDAIMLDTSYLTPFDSANRVLQIAKPLIEGE
jgi:cytidylate kinase